LGRSVKRRNLKRLKTSKGLKPQKA